MNPTITLYNSRYEVGPTLDDEELKEIKSHLSFLKKAQLKILGLCLITKFDESEIYLVKRVRNPGYKLAIQQGFDEIVVRT